MPCRLVYGPGREQETERLFIAGGDHHHPSPGRPSIDTKFLARIIASRRSSLFALSFSISLACVHEVFFCFSVSPPWREVFDRHTNFVRNTGVGFIFFLYDPGMYVRECGQPGRWDGTEMLECVIVRTSRYPYDIFRGDPSPLSLHHIH